MSSWRFGLVLWLPWMFFWACPGLAADETITIKLRFIIDAEHGHTPEAQGETEAILEEYVAELNQIYLNSKVILRAEVADFHYARIESADAVVILRDMAQKRKTFATIFSKIDELDADYTIAVVTNLEVRGSSVCGRAFAVNKTIAYISSPSRSFLVINIHPVCGAQTLAHELGHLMGLNHGALVDSCQPGMGHATALTPHANGYGWGNCDGVRQAGEFGTIMVGGYLRHVTGENRGNLPIFSNPEIHDVRCGPKGICGDPLIGDAARALNTYAHEYARHRMRAIDLHDADAKTRSPLEQHGGTHQKLIIDPDQKITPHPAAGPDQ